ncbi:MAG: amidohydrolase [Oscillospiraceae bacterium]|nr:amidohydrolase [Oscillospiraceae bacterium]
MEFLLTNARLVPVVSDEIENGFLWVRDGKIRQLGPMDSCPAAGEIETRDAKGLSVYPGFIDAHCHLGMLEDGLDFEGDDVNESTDPVTPQLRAVDGLNPLDRCFAEARAAGVTCVVTGPGSANPIGGQLAVVKTAGLSADDMVLRAPAAIKFAFGENPKSVYHDRKETPVTRMGTAALIRETLEKARRYMEKKEPEYDAKCEALLPLLRGEIPAHCHAHRADDIFTALRICREFHLRCVIIHGTEGHLIAPRLAQEGAPVVAGPVLCDRCKPELRALTPSGPGVLHRAGIPTALCTDHTVIPIQYLPILAGLCVREGMPRQAALRAITRTPAEILGLADTVGGLAPGLDADFTLYRGDPLSLEGKCAATYIQGEEVYESEEVFVNFE